MYFPHNLLVMINCLGLFQKKEVENVKIWYELWAKGGATPNFVVENRVDYISSFNWVKNWLNVYFFNKMSDYILSIILLVVIFYFAFFSKVKSNFKKRKILYYYIFFDFVYLIEWFLYHPSLRYGGYHIFILIVSIPLIISIEKFELSWTSFRKKAIIFVMITLVIFSWKKYS